MVIGSGHRGVMQARSQLVAEGRRLITVALVDDEPLIREALGRALCDAGVELVGEADTTVEATRLVVDLRPDVVLMDIKLFGSSGVQAIEQLSLLAPASRILILTRTEHDRVVEAIVAGACGYILKTAPRETITAAVIATAAGESAISPQIAGQLLQRIRQRDTPLTASARDTANAIRAVLTEREFAIFSCLASGKSNRDIADEFALSANTIANHISSILAKLHLENRVQAAVHAVRSGIS